MKMGFPRFAGIFVFVLACSCGSEGQEPKQTQQPEAVPENDESEAIEGPKLVQALNPPDSSVQMFRWRWNDIAKECREWLGPQGFGAVQVSPPTVAADIGPWWDVYQPVNYTSFRSKMGSEAEFQSMINACHAAKVRIYVDVVFNHLASGSGRATDGGSFPTGPLGYANFSSADFHETCAIESADYGAPGNRSSVVNCRLANLPDLKTESPYVQGQIRNYLNKLVSMGVDGLRIDAAKHIQASHISEILSRVNRTTRNGETLWVTQEVIPDGNVTRSDYYPNGTLNEFKFTYAMKETFRNMGTSISQIPSIMGTPGKWGGSWDFLPSEKATVFVNNWDSERYQSSLVASDYVPGHINDVQGNKRYDLANIFMLAWPYGHAQIHSGYRFTSIDQGPPDSSPYDQAGNPLINQSWDFIHRWSNIANMVAFRSTVSGTGVDLFVSGTPNQIAFSRGDKGFVAINNDSGTWNATLKTRLPAGTYCNVATGKRDDSTRTCSGGGLVVDGQGMLTFVIPGNDGWSMPAVALHINQRI